jgi:hypothetical protein
MRVNLVELTIAKYGGLES